MELNSGDTAWVLASTALVLLMTPGLAFFYAGMVRSKHHNLDRCRAQLALLGAMTLGAVELERRVALR